VVVRGPRLHCTLTSTASNCILMASEPSETVHDCREGHQAGHPRVRRRPPPGKGGKR
jgi:hypothetical protein